MFWSLLGLCVVDEEIDKPTTPATKDLELYDIVCATLKLITKVLKKNAVRAILEVLIKSEKLHRHEIPHKTVRASERAGDEGICQYKKVDTQVNLSITSLIFRFLFLYF